MIRLASLDTKELEEIAEPITEDIPAETAEEKQAASAAMRELIRRNAPAPAHLHGPSCCDITYAAVFPHIHTQEFATPIQHMPKSAEDDEEVELFPGAR